MSKPKAFYFPGKLGDALLQWPVAEQWLRDHDEQAEVWIDPTCTPAQSLFAAEKTVSTVKIVAPADNYTCGGQPWQGKFGTDEHLQYEIVPMGFRAFPQRQITLQTALDCPLKIDTKRLATEPAFHVEHSGKANRVVLHGTFASHNSGVPRFWRVLHDIKADLEANFDEIVFVGTPDERGRAMELYPPSSQWGFFDDHGSFLELAQEIVSARLVMAAGSSVAALGGVLKVPTLRVHDPIGQAPKVIWAGLGDNQWNEEEVAIRTLWPEILRTV